MLNSLLRRSIHPLCQNSHLQRHTKPMATNTALDGVSNSTQPTPAAAIDFLMLLQKLKVTKRTGWVKCNVQQPESIADHMYRMGMMSMLASDAGVDAGRCIRMALVHDVAEAIVGGGSERMTSDITPHCKVSDEEKYKLESDAIQQIKEMLGATTQAAHEIEALWQDYEQQSTPESHLVKDFDKLEMIIQAHEYEQDQGLQLQQFFDSTQGKFKTETGRAWAQELIQRRQKAAQVAAGGSSSSARTAADADVQ